MRKLLLASAAMLGATSGLALAQMPMNPTQGQMTSTPSSTSSTANTNNNYLGQPDTFHGYTSIFAGAVAAPTPGTLVIKFNGKVEVDMDASWASANSAVPGPLSGGVRAITAGSSKVNPIAFGSFMRLYPAVDGMAANGLRYGASIELRENFPGSTAQPTPALSPAPSGSTYSSGETVFVRRAFTYMAADNVGIVRFGQGDGVIGLFDPCVFSAQCWDAGAGNFNGGPLQSMGPSGPIAIPFVWLAQAGAEYGNTKIVYLSPQFAGFDFGVQYAPNMNNGYSACGTGTEASSACAMTTSGTDATRWYNQVALGGRYQGVFGPVRAGVYGVYETAGRESGPFESATALTPAARTSLAAVTGLRYDNLSFVSAATYATLTTGVGDVTASFDYIGGALNGQLAMRPTGGASEHGELAGLLLKNGPLTLGAEYGVVDSQGDARLTGISQRHEYEVAFGGNYAVAPGLFLVAEYMYEHRHQGDFDFANNAVGSPTNGLGTRDAQARGVMFSTVVNW